MCGVCYGELPPAKSQLHEFRIEKTLIIHNIEEDMKEDGH